jgi:hypothetical protein
VLAERRAALKREEGARRRGEARLAQELAFRDRLLANLANLAAGKQQEEELSRERGSGAVVSTCMQQEEELSRAAAIQGHQVQSSAIKELSRAAAIQGHQVQSSAIKELSRAAAIQGHPVGASFGARHDASEGKAWRALMEGIAVKVRRPLMTLVDEPR